MANGDFVLTSGILGAASVRAGLHRYLPWLPRAPRKVTDEEARAFLASLAPTPAPHHTSAAHDTCCNTAAPASTRSVDDQVLAGR
jgi:hypothetical protein